MREICFEVVDAGEHGGECHDRHDQVRKNVILPHKRTEYGAWEIGEDRLEEHDASTDHLRYGLDLTEHTCRNDDTGIACDDEAKAGYAKLTKKDKKNYGDEDEREGLLSVQE